MKVFCDVTLNVEKGDMIIARVLSDEGEDDYEDYFEDTMRAGHYENNKRAVNLMIRSSNDIIRDLLWRNVDFVRAEDGELAFTREGAHSRPRILFHEDITGIGQTLAFIMFSP